MSAAVTLTAASRRAALKEAVALLRRASLDTPVLDARLIVQHALGVDWEALFLKDDEPLNEGDRGRLQHGLARRLAREPVARIVGRRHFWTLELAVTPDTLDPRPETETVIEAALAALPDRLLPLRILDLGTGTGALLLALLKEYPKAVGVGLDRSAGALNVVRLNADSHGLSERYVLVQGDWTRPLTGHFDLIVSNPPYIATGDLAALPPEVREYDPAIALDGGPDGVNPYRAILPALPALLAADGLALVEIGAGQADAIAAIARESGLAVRERRKDLGGIDRVLRLVRASDGREKADRRI